jgi:hypothetical protein
VSSRLLVLAALLLAACASDPERPAETPVTYRTVYVDKPVPCFTEAERPILPPLTPIDVDNATTDQMAAAVAADLENERLYTAAVDALFLKCQAAAGKAPSQ